MKRNLLITFRKKYLFIPLFLFLSMFNVKQKNTAYADGFVAEDFNSNVYFDPYSFANNNNYYFIDGTREKWTSSDQEVRHEYFVFDTFHSHLETVSTIYAYHVQGKESLNLGVGASLLTEEETIHTFGVENSTKIGIVIAKIGGGWKWGNISSKTISTEGYATIDINKSTGYYGRTALCTIREYFLVTRDVRRKVNRDKKGNITGYSNYSATNGDNTGKFENFDFDYGVKYNTDKR